jgi:hypothetical protein
MRSRYGAPPFCPRHLLGRVDTKKRQKECMGHRDLVFLPFSSRVVRGLCFFFFLCFHVENSLKTVESQTGGRVDKLWELVPPRNPGQSAYQLSKKGRNQNSFHTIFGKQNFEEAQALTTYQVVRNFFVFSILGILYTSMKILRYQFGIAGKGG